MVSMLDSVSSGPGSRAGEGVVLCCVLGKDALLSQCFS